MYVHAGLYSVNTEFLMILPPREEAQYKILWLQFKMQNNKKKLINVEEIVKISILEHLRRDNPSC